MRPDRGIRLSAPDAGPDAVAEAIERTWREEWGRLLGLLVARFRRLDLAEDALAEAFEAATRTWRTDGIPVNRPAWLLTAARRRAIDRLRAEAVAARTEPLLVVDARTQQEAQRTMADSGDHPALADERLRLIFLCAHPALAPEAAAALTLRMVLGVSTGDLARLFLVSEPTMAARLTRARKKLAAAGAPFALPPADRIPERVGVLATIAYLAFTAGYAPGSGPDVLRAGLAGEAVRLTRLVRTLVPGYAALDALLALMLIQHSRRETRVDAAGELVLLADQDRSRWRRAEIDEALALLSPWRDADPVTLPVGHAGDYLLQALIATEHAIAADTAGTDWARIADLYAVLDARTGSPSVRLARAVAVAESSGPHAGLALLDGLADRLPGSHRVPAVRAELLSRAGDHEAAEAAYAQAIALCANDAERGHLCDRRDRKSG